MPGKISETPASSASKRDAGEHRSEMRATHHADSYIPARQHLQTGHETNPVIVVVGNEEVPSAIKRNSRRTGQLRADGRAVVAAKSRHPVADRGSDDCRWPKT